MPKRKQLAKRDTNVPGISTDPATNLIMADIAMRTGSYILRNVVEKSILKRRYGKEDARQIMENRSFKQTAASVIVSKIATRSMPGAILVGSGLVVKALFDRSQKRRQAKRAGDRKLLESPQDS